MEAKMNNNNAIASFNDDNKPFSTKFDEEQLEGLKQDREQRKLFATLIYYFMCAYSGIVLAVVILDGCSVLNVNSTVLNIMLSTTTANVIGLFVIVAKYLFNRKES